MEVVFFLSYFFMFATRITRLKPYKIFLLFLFYCYCGLFEGCVRVRIGFKGNSLSIFGLLFCLLCRSYTIYEWVIAQRRLALVSSNINLFLHVFVSNKSKQFCFKKLGCRRRIIALAARNIIDIYCYTLCNYPYNL